MCMPAGGPVAEKPAPIGRQSPLANPVPRALRMVRQAMKDARNRRLFERYQTVWLVLNGHTYAQVSKIIGRSVTTVFNYMQAYQQGGLGALNLQHSPGRPRYLTPDQEQQVKEVVTNKTPQDVGFPAEMNWTAPLVARYMAETFQVEFSERGARSLLYRLGFSCTRPTYTLAKADPDKQKKFKRQVRRQKHRLRHGEIDRLLFEDESMIRDYQAIGRTWFPKGQQKQIPTYGKHWGTKLLGTLDYGSGEVLWDSADHYDAATFLAFLEQVVAHYPGERIVMVLDNAKIHHAKLIQPFLEQHQKTLTLMFLPPYSPRLNLIEGLWGWLKRSVIYNVFFKTVQAITDAVTAFIDERNTDRAATKKRLCWL